MSKLIKLLKKAVKIVLREGPTVFLNKAKRKVQEKLRFLRISRSELKKIHLVSAVKLQEQRNTVFQSKPRISILTPLYNTPKQYLLELIESLENQTYSEWELCLADGSDKEYSYVEDICKKAVQKDSRIIYKQLDENKGISENTNACIEIASGEYYGLLDHDDILHPSALFEVVKVINEQSADFIYTDEVKYDGNIQKISNLAQFNLKPGFGKDELRSHNYICHFTVFSKTLLLGTDEIYRSKFDGSQDHDMVLRLTEKAKSIVHIPKVLYYWRVHENSVSMDIGTKPYVVEAAHGAIKDQLMRSSESGVVKSNLPYETIYRTTYDLPNPLPLVTVIVREYKKEAEAVATIAHIQERTDYPNVEYLRTRNEAIDETIKAAKGEYIILFAAKCEAHNRNWIEEMLMFAQRKDVGVVGPKIIDFNYNILYAGISLDASSSTKLRYLCEGMHETDQGYEAMLTYVRNTTACTATCMMFSKRVWKQLDGFKGGMKEYHDIDFCLRGKEAGLNHVWTSFSQIRYRGYMNHAIRKKKHTDAFEKRWKNEIENEKFCHPLWIKYKLV